MKKKSIILTLLLVICLTVIAGGLSSCEPSLHEYWDARMDGGVLRIYGPTQKGKEQETLFLPAYIDGHKVELLEGRTAFWATTPSYPQFGPKVKRIIIEGNVTVGFNFFNGGGYPVIEFLGKGPIVLRERSISFVNRVIIIPDGSPDNYMIPDGNPDNYMGDDTFSGESYPFFKSETKDGYLIKDGVYMGYFGDEKELVIPEGVTKIHDTRKYYCLSGKGFDTVKIPSTVTYIQKENMFSTRSGAIYVSENTVIEEGAFKEGANIIRY